MKLPQPPAIDLPVAIGPNVVLTRDLVQDMPITPTAARGIIASLEATSSSILTPTADDVTDAVTIPRRIALARRTPMRGYIPELDTSIVNALQLVCCNESIQNRREQETTLITNTIGATDFTITAFMQYPTCCPVGQPNRVFAKSSAASTEFRLTSVNDTVNATGDPAVAENPYGSGIKPDRAYVVATDGPSSHLPPSQLSMWYTDDGGVPNPPSNPTGFFGPNLVLAETTPPPGTHRYFLDKPAIAVSWNANTLGTVYVAAVRADLDVPLVPGSATELDYVHYPFQLVVLRCDNGLTFTKTAVLSSTYSSIGNDLLPNAVPHAPQIIVDQDTGAVYLFWLEWNNNVRFPGDPQANKIFVAKSDASATGFRMLGSFNAGTLLGVNSDGLQDPLGHQVFQRSMLNARYTVGRHKIGVVWHARENDGAHADVFYNAFDTSTLTWSGIQAVNHNGASVYGNDRRDQWNGALDNNGSGTVMVTYYDRRDDQHLYRMYATKLNEAGVHLETSDAAIQRVGIEVASEPDRTVALIADGSSATVGEYQDLWYWRDWKGAFIYAPAPSGPCAVYSSDVNP